MTKDDAKQVLQMLLGAFTRHGLDDSGVRMWADALSRHDFDDAVSAAQLVIQRVEECRFTLVDELPPSARGEDGFGSTGR